MAQIQATQPNTQQPTQHATAARAFCNTLTIMGVATAVGALTAKIFSITHPAAAAIFGAVYSLGMQVTRYFGGGESCGIWIGGFAATVAAAIFSVKAVGFFLSLKAALILLIASTLLECAITCACACCLIGTGAAVSLNG
jgi:hypothetical protein